MTPLSDFVTYNDAITKMRFAAEHLKATAEPFFLVTGIKRPHLNWRYPEGYASLYPDENVTLPTQKILDKSVNPIAYTTFPMDAPGGEVKGDFVTSPYVSGSDAQLRELRKGYYSVVSWADFAVGQVLSELESLGLENSTMVVLHSDHGRHSSPR